jgi:hypothetical protein
VGEENSQGITRRDLLRRGAVLGGAVVWTTPVVQTLGMGRAFAQTASPEGGKDISYIGINVDCGTSQFFVKYEDGEGWENEPGAAPECADPSNSVFDGMNGGSLGFDVTMLSESCARLSIPEEYRSCSLTIWVKGGQTCNTIPYSGEASLTVCTATA